MKVVSVALLVAMPLFAFPSNSPKDDSPTDRVLKTSTSIIPLSESALIGQGSKQTINLFPGLRATFVGDSLSLASHDGSDFILASGSRKLTLLSPSIAVPTATGWMIAGNDFSAGDPIVARLKAQDDTDTNLKSMQESAKKLKSRNNEEKQDNKGPGKKLMVRWLYGENPFPTAELFNSAAIQQLTHLSSIGF